MSLNTAAQTSNLQSPNVLPTNTSAKNPAKHQTQTKAETAVVPSTPLLTMPPADTSHNSKKLLVLDVNGLLLHRVRGPVPATVKHNPDAKFRRVKLFARPHMRAFVQWCLHHFHVAIWSSATRENAELLSQFVFGANFRETTAFVWSQDHCRQTGLMHRHDRHKPVVLKELRRIWQDAELGRCFDHHNTLLIDDSAHKACMNPAHTAIHPPAWTCDMQDDGMLGPGSVLTKFLQGLVCAGQVAPYVAQCDPFEVSPCADHGLIAAIQSRLKGTEAGVAADRGAQDNFEIDGLADEMRRLGRV